MSRISIAILILIVLGFIMTIRRDAPDVITGTPAINTATADKGNKAPPPPGKGTPATTAAADKTKSTTAPANKAVEITTGTTAQQPVQIAVVEQDKPGNIPNSATATQQDTSILEGGENMGKEAQNELVRLGCFSGDASQRWGRDSRAAVKRFNQISRFSWPDWPTRDMIASFRGFPDGYCKKCRNGGGGVCDVANLDANKDASPRPTASDAPVAPYVSGDNADRPVAPVKPVKPVTPAPVVAEPVKPVTPAPVVAEPVKPVTPAPVVAEPVKPVTPAPVVAVPVKPVTPAPVVAEVPKPATPETTSADANLEAALKAVGPAGPSKIALSRAASDTPEEQTPLDSYKPKGATETSEETSDANAPAERAPYRAQRPSAQRQTNVEPRYTPPVYVAPRARYSKPAWMRKRRSAPRTVYIAPPPPIYITPRPRYRDYGESHSRGGGGWTPRPQGVGR